MASTHARNTVKGSVQDLLFHSDAEVRRDAAATLGARGMRVADEREALEALNMAREDPSNSVQDVVLQSLVRLSLR